MTDPATKEIVTPGKHKVVLKAEATGHDVRAIEAATLSGTEISATGETKLSGTTIHEATDVALKRFVLSVDGAEGDIISLLGDLPAADYQSVVAEVNAITSPVSSQKKS